MLDVSGIEIPPAGAALLMLTVPISASPPQTLLGHGVIDVRPGARTVTVQVLVVDPRVAEIVTWRVVWTADATILNVTAVLPSGVSTTGTIWTAGSLEDNWIA